MKVNRNRVEPHYPDKMIEARMRHYTQLTETQRYQISALKKAGLSQEKIALNIGVHPSTISRELRRNKGLRGYRPAQAQRKATERHHKKPKAIRLGSEQIGYIEKYITQEWSPEQISHTMQNAEISRVSHETIYRYLEEGRKRGGTLYTHLRHKSRKYRKRYGSNDRRGRIRNRVSIDERPEIVDKRSRIGDFEIDTVIGKNHKQALVTLVDRYSKLTLIKKVTHKRAELVRSAAAELLAPIAH